MVIKYTHILTSMVSFPDFLPWYVFIDVDGDDKDLSLVLSLRYGEMEHVLIHSDDIRKEQFCESVTDDDIEECFDSIIGKVCDRASCPDCRFLPLDSIINETVAEFRKYWCKKYHLPSVDHQ